MRKKSCGWRVFLVLGLLLSLVGGLAIPNELAASAVEAASVYLDPPSQVLEVGGTTTIDIRITNVRDLYGVEIHLAFEPTLLKVVDADLNMDGVQIAPSTDFFPFSPDQYFVDPETGERYYFAYCPDVGGYFIAQAEADNAAGTISYAFTLLYPAPPVSVGPEGKVLATITFERLAVGEANITFVNPVAGEPPVKLADVDGEAITILPANIKGAVIVAPPQEDWAVDMTITTYPPIGGVGYPFGFGARDGATDEFDPGDAVAPPPPPAGISAYFYYPENPPVARKLIRSIVAPAETITWPLVIEVIVVGPAEMTISWDGDDVAAVPPEYTILELRDAEGVTLADMRAVTSYTFSVSPGDAHHFDIVASVVAMDFSLAVDPAAATIYQGEETTATITATHQAGPVENVTLTAELSEGVTGITVSFDPAVGEPEPIWESTMIITATTDATVGVHPIIITGTSYPGGGVATVNFTLTVVEAHIAHIVLVAGWNMISLPLDVVGCPFELLPGALAVFAWDPEAKSYVTPTELVAGKGYWVLVLEDVTHTIAGMPLAEYTFSGVAGWHMIGSIWVDGAVEVISGTVLPTLFTWDPVAGGYIFTEILEPGRGYWLLGLTDFEVRVHPVPPPPPEGS